MSPRYQESETRVTLQGGNARAAASRLREPQAERVDVGTTVPPLQHGDRYESTARLLGRYHQVGGGCWAARDRWPAASATPACWMSDSERLVIWLFAGAMLSYVAMLSEQGLSSAGGDLTL